MHGLYDGERPELFFRRTPPATLGHTTQLILQLCIVPGIYCYTTSPSGYRNVYSTILLVQAEQGLDRKTFLALPTGETSQKARKWILRQSFYGQQHALPEQAAFLSIYLRNNNMVKPHGRLVLVG